MFIACNALESGKPIYGRNGFPTAVPFDVRNASGLPAGSILDFGLRPGFGAQPRYVVTIGRKRGALPHIGPHSRIPLAELLSQSHFGATHLVIKRSKNSRKRLAAFTRRG